MGERLPEAQTADFLASMVEGRLGEAARRTPLSIVCEGGPTEQNVFPLVEVMGWQVIRDEGNKVKKVALLVTGPTTGPIAMVSTHDEKDEIGVPSDYPDMLPIFRHLRKILAVTVGHFISVPR